MKLASCVRRALGALLIVGTASVVMPPPAHAACVVAYVVVYYEQAPDQVIVDPSQCLVPTPFPEYPLTVGGGNHHQGPPLSPGMPSGFHVQVWVPA